MQNNEKLDSKSLLSQYLRLIYLKLSIFIHDIFSPSKLFTFYISVHLTLVKPL